MSCIWISDEMGDENELTLPMKWGFENMKLYSEHGALNDGDSSLNLHGISKVCLTEWLWPWSGELHCLKQLHFPPSGS